MSEPEPTSAEDWDSFRAMMNEKMADSSLKHYDREGTEIGAGDAMYFGANPDYCRVALSTVTDNAGGSVEVSTIWLGIDFGHGFSSTPVIFETMSFDETGAPVPELCDRYTSVEDAQAGHVEIVARAAQAMESPVTLHVHPAP